MEMDVKEIIAKMKIATQSVVGQQRIYLQFVAQKIAHNNSKTIIVDCECVALQKVNIFWYAIPILYIYFECNLCIFLFVMS